MDSKVAPLYLVASEQNLLGVHWTQQNVPMLSSLTRKDPASSILSRAVTQLKEYFKGEREEFDLPLDAEGTEFQKRVWKQLQQIPYGQTRSYQEIARKVRNPKACRAVGTANGRNPLSIIVPCHRVITSSGTLGGYAGGLNVKEKLLRLEGRSLSG